MNNSLICTSSVVEISVKPDKLYQRYVFMDEYEITERKYLFFKKNIKIDRGFVWDGHLDNNNRLIDNRLDNNDTELLYIIEDGYVYDNNEKMNAYTKENAEFFIQNKNNSFIGSSNFNSWFNKTLGDRFYYEVVSDEQTGRVKEILVYKKGCIEILLSNNDIIYSYNSKTDSKRFNELLKEFARGIAEYPFMIVEKMILHLHIFTIRRTKYGISDL
jgi:hypothetical protein